MQVPIRINMGETEPEGKLLGKREFYIYKKNDDDYILWVGKDDEQGSAIPVSVVNAQNATSVDTDNSVLKVEKGSQKGTVAGMEVSIDTVDDDGNTVHDATLKPVVDGTVTVSSITLNDLKKLVLSDTMYGENTPSKGSGVEGQLFFKI